MNVDRAITLVSVIVASAATAASTIQAYVSWEGRNDILRSIVLTQFESKCADLNRDTHLFRQGPSSMQYETIASDVEQIASLAGIFSASAFEDIAQSAKNVQLDVDKATSNGSQTEKDAYSMIEPLITEMSASIEERCIKINLENTGHIDPK